MSNSTQRFETVGDLYRRATGFLRPGKSVAPECGYDSSSDENRERFETWLATRGLTDALDRIAELEHKIGSLERRLDGVVDGNLPGGMSIEDLDR